MLYPRSMPRKCRTFFNLPMKNHMRSCKSDLLGQTKLFCCYSDSPVVFWGQWKKKLNWVKGCTVGLQRANLPHVLLYCKKAKPGIHPSVWVQIGCRILLKKIRFTSLEITFPELFLYTQARTRSMCMSGVWPR